MTCDSTTERHPAAGSNGANSDGAAWEAHRRNHHAVENTGLNES